MKFNLKNFDFKNLDNKVKIFLILLGLLFISNLINKPKINFITFEQAADDINSFDYIIDVRSKEEISEGRLMSNNLITMESLIDHPRMMKFVPEFVNKEDKILIYCRSGARSKLAAELFVKNGYTNVYSVSNGGYEELIRAIAVYDIWYEDHIE